VESQREEMEGANALGPAHPSITLLEDNAVAELTKAWSYCTAASEATLSGGGLHAARFTVRKGSMYFGAIRADCDLKRGAENEVQGHCFYGTGEGRRYPGWRKWQGMQGAKEAGDRIDLLLDLSVGSMLVFKNGELLGVMQGSGLGGAGVEYRWAIVLHAGSGGEGSSARIDVVPATELEALVQVREALVAQREQERLARVEKGVLGPAHPDITLLEDNHVAKKTEQEFDVPCRTAASEATLSGGGGQHAARFTRGKKGSEYSLAQMLFGVIRADCDVVEGRNATQEEGHCFYHPGGRCYPSGTRWEGMQRAWEEGDRIDLLLDLDDGSMFVAKNGEPLGIMQESGLGGAGVEYRWAISLYDCSEGESARFDMLPAAEVEALLLAKKACKAQRERERLAALEEGVFPLGSVHRDIMLSEGSLVATKMTEYDYYDYFAASEKILSGAGRYAARFTVRVGGLMNFGVIPADWDPEYALLPRRRQGHCLYYIKDGRQLKQTPQEGDWKGMQPAKEGDRIDMLLDLGAGSMFVAKNGEPLGVMQESGLGGAGVEYRWAMLLAQQGSSARIDAVPAAELEGGASWCSWKEAQEAERERMRLEREAQREAREAQQERERLEREARWERERLEQEAREAQREREELAQVTSEQDVALPAGTRLCVEGHASDGVYQRWERRTFGANAHFVDFSAEGVQQVALKGLSPSQLLVLPPLVVTVRAVEITGTETVEIEGVSLDWSVSRLNAAIAARRGVSVELQRLVVGDVALDDADALLSLCGVAEGTLVHVVAQTEVVAAERAATVAAGAAVGGTAGIAEGQPPGTKQAQGSRGRREKRGGWLCCASR
jgi:hypothetical protein